MHPETAPENTAASSRTVVEIVAHRGASDLAPENTLAAVRAGWAAGADAVEVDIHRTLDGRIVVIHDESTKRTTGVDALVAKQTLDDLRKLDAGAWKGPRWRNERIPTLEEVLATVPERKRLLIEVKCGPEVLGELVRAISSSRKAPEQTAVIGFELETVAAVKRALPRLEVYLLSGFKQDEATFEWSPRIEELVERAKAAGLDGLDLGAKGPLDEEAAREIRSAGLDLHVWTVDDAETARRMRALGVDGITTNRPGELRRELEGK